MPETSRTDVQEEKHLCAWLWERNVGRSPGAEEARGGKREKKVRTETGSLVCRVNEGDLEEAVRGIGIGKPVAQSSQLGMAMEDTEDTSQHSSGLHTLG